MINILILGGGVSAERFVESYLFNDNYSLTICCMNKYNKSFRLIEKYQLNSINYNDLNSNSINNYDVIIVSLPLVCKYEVIEKIVSLGYKGRFIIEKPFASNVDESKKIISLLKNNYFVIPYSRRFLNFKYEFKDYNKIIWNIVDSIPKNMILTEALPHIIDFIQYNIGICKELDDIKYNGNILSFNYNKKYIEIEFNNNREYIINDILMDKLDYVKANNIMLNELLTMNKEKEQIIIDDLNNNMLCFERILGYE